MAFTYRFLDDVAIADLAFEAVGDSPQDLFSGATQALLESLADPLSVAAVWERHVSATDSDLSNLLFDWLSLIVYWKDAAGVVFREAPLVLTCDSGIWTLQGRLIGAPVNQQSQELRNDVKGITKHLYDLTQNESEWRARVVLDV